jgi:hypothetical protein
MTTPWAVWFSGFNELFATLGTKLWICLIFLNLLILVTPISPEKNRGKEEENEEWKTWDDNP